MTLTKIYNPFDIIVVPFPFVDKANNKKRPALVLSQTEFQKETQHLCCLMITSAKHSYWFGDHSINELESTGLETASIIRQKVFTIDSRSVIKKIGQLSKKDTQQVKNILKQNLAL